MPKKVLVVEDNDTYRKVIVTAIRSGNFTVLEAENGLRGLELTRSEHPDLILLDIYMPEMDGMTMLTEIKRDKELASTRVVMLTNVQEELDHAVKNGADEAILKSSVTPPQIVELCQKYL